MIRGGLLSVLLAAGTSAPGAPGPLDSSYPPALQAAEPLSPLLRVELAARYLDGAALRWQEEKKCGTCHTNFAHLMARSSASSIVPPPAEVRRFFEEMVTRRWEEKGPRWDAEVVCAAVTLAWDDRETSGELHPATRKALDRMASLQREDGGWTWLVCGWPPMESDDHYGVTFAAIGLGAAPGGYAATETGRRALEGIRGYLRANPPPSLHHEAMALWASAFVDGILSAEEKSRILERLFAVQNADGGWSLARLLDGWKEHRRQDREPQDLRSSDGYATGFAVYVARAAGISRDDPRIRKGLRWLSGNQRLSGRWYTRSPTRDSWHYISNAGTAFALMAIQACRDPATPAAGR
jgi:squalene-hopene/tetraprenyl-beta-curcumene cyclase